MGARWLEGNRELHRHRLSHRAVCVPSPRLQSPHTRQYAHPAGIKACCLPRYHECLACAPSPPTKAPDERLVLRMQPHAGGQTLGKESPLCRWAGRAAPGRGPKGWAVAAKAKPKPRNLPKGLFLQADSALTHRAKVSERVAKCAHPLGNQSRTSAARSTRAPATWPHCLSLLPCPGVPRKRWLAQ